MKGRANVPSPRDSVSFLMPAELRARARETYRRTAPSERDRSWAGFLITAVLREVERREQLYNEGRPYPVTDEPLRPGRRNGRLFAEPEGGKR